MNEKEIYALIKLLDDTDVEVFEHIETRLISYGRDVIPFLENAWSQSFEVLLQERIENIIHKIQFDKLCADLSDWTTESGNLLKGAILIAKYQYPDLDESKLRLEIEQIKRDVWLELNDNLTAIEQVKILNDIFFSIYGFSGNTTNFHAPQNSFIHLVIESRKGNPLSLSLLYSVVAQELGIPIFGVNLPEHFILAYKDLSAILPVHDKNVVKVLFYINPFSKGSIFSRKEITAFLKQLKITPETKHYEPCSNIDIIRRLIRNLIYSYQKLGHSEKVEELQILIKSLNK